MIFSIALGAVAMETPMNIESESQKHTERINALVAASLIKQQKKSRAVNEQDYDFWLNALGSKANFIDIEQFFEVFPIPPGVNKQFLSCVESATYEHGPKVTPPDDFFQTLRRGNNYCDVLVSNKINLGALYIWVLIGLHEQKVEVNFVKTLFPFLGFSELAQSLKHADSITDLRIEFEAPPEFLKFLSKSLFNRNLATDEDIHRLFSKNGLKQKRVKEAFTSRKRPRTIAYAEVVELLGEGGHTYSEIADAAGISVHTARDYAKIAEEHEDIEPGVRQAAAREHYKRRSVNIEDTTVFSIASAINDGSVSSYDDIVARFGVKRTSAHTLVCRARREGLIDINKGERIFAEITNLEKTAELIKARTPKNSIIQQLNVPEWRSVNRLISHCYELETLEASDVEYLKPTVSRAEKNGVTRKQIHLFLSARLLDDRMLPEIYTKLTREFNSSAFALDHRKISDATFGEHEKKLIELGRLSQQQRRKYLKVEKLRK